MVIKTACSAVAAIAIGCTLVLGGCSSQESGTDAGGTDASGTASQAPTAASSNVLYDAAAATQKAGSARITGSISDPSGASDNVATISGVQTFDPVAVDLTLTLEGQGSVRQVIVDGKAYVQMPEFGDQWMSIDLGAVGGSLTPLMTGADISTLPTVTPDGTGEIEGTAVTFYTADVDLKESLLLSGLPEEAIDASAGALAEDPGSAKLRVAIDDSGRLVQWNMVTTVNLADGTSSTSTMDLRYYDFGVPTDIKAPAPDQVIDGNSLGAPGVQP